ncbi:hypothetical protein [Ruminococcus sp.]|uniref:hypothetical protein n=1 Tax=Ruminococcus sp. TaxID=41978 RepID=UPI002E787B69|nr:hypothetical protein [Ruminococcus sp.]MEE1262135.1 hypothetical protein [Ruminococcus sp.]
MNIQDYRIQTGVLHAYIVRSAKKGQVILEPGRVITEGEILNLIAWWLDKELKGAKSESQFITKDGERIIELKRLKNYDI